MTEFSERIGVVRPRALQVREMDAPLRNALWNWLCWALQKESRSHGTWTDEYWYKAAEGGVWDEVMHLTVDDIPLNPQAAIKKWFMAQPWTAVYECVEFVLPRVNRFRDEYDRHKPSEIVDHLSRKLERELSGYRVVRGELVPVTSPTEISEIERASTPRIGFERVAEHVNTALALLGLKPEPDYRNSIKESISAVEAAAKLLAGEKSGGIDTALAILDRRHNLHPAFKIALSKLYAYTSDENGIRHCALEETTISEAEARFMLVACSAFANWLLATADGKTA